MKNILFVWVVIFYVFGSKGVYAQFPDTTGKVYLKIKEAYAEALKAPQKVRKINFATTGLSSISDTFFRFSAVEYLELSHNQLKSFPLEKLSNPHLSWLGLECNQITELPDISQRFPYLEYLKIGRNQLKGAPAWIGNLLELKVLDLSYCKINQLPDSFSRLRNLKKLDLTGNELTVIPSCIRNMIALDTLCLRGNFMEAKNLELYLPPYIKHLDVSPLSLSPSELANLHVKFPYLKYINYGPKNLPFNAKEAPTLSKIPLAAGFRRIETDSLSFGAYLRNLVLAKEGTTVRLHNGTEKREQHLHEYVIPISQPQKDLQQCADVAIRLYADYLYFKGDLDKISFQLTNKFEVPFSKWAKGFRVKVRGNRTYWQQTGKPDRSYEALTEYLEFVFHYAGSFSLSQSLPKVDYKDARVGDLWVTGGFPGHVAMIGDLAVNPATGDTIFLLLQGNTPAQELEIGRNLNDPVLSPWIQFPPGRSLLYPRRRFSDFTLMRFKE